jgi:hypothetical protein
MISRSWLANILRRGKRQIGSIESILYRIAEHFCKKPRFFGSIGSIGSLGCAGLPNGGKKEVA